MRLKKGLLLATGAVVVAALLWLFLGRIEIVGDYAMTRLRGGYTVADRLEQFGGEARARLEPYFEAAGVEWPGQRVAMLAFKDLERLELHAQTDAGAWRYIRAYPVLAASGRLGPKLREGDRQVPEGIYRVISLNPNSRYHVSLRLDYPNVFDRKKGQHDGRENLGGDIMIHGKQVSIGCLAMGDLAAEELFTLAALVGQENVEVVIAPTDFRRQALVPPTEPAWIADLYQLLQEELRQFPARSDRR